jgi:alpha-1,3-rhamnosyl/mannosyltransferase
VRGREVRTVSNATEGYAVAACRPARDAVGGCPVTRNSRLRLALDFRPALLGQAGIARAARELATALARRDDVELHLFGHSFARARVPPPPELARRLHRLPLPGRCQPALARVGLDAARLAGRARLFHWTDTIHPPVRSCPALLTVHDLAFAEDPEYHGPAAEGLLARARAAAAAAARIVTPTAATRDAVVRILGVAPERVRVIPFGADHVPSALPPPPIAGDYAVCIGTIEPRKNHLRLLAAWRRLPAPRPPLVVVGRPGWQCADAVAALRAGVAAGELRWLRDAGDAQLFGCLAHARLLVYPSLLEGFGFPPLEALALGVPVVAGRPPALDEVLGDAARTCDPRSVGALADAVAEVWRDDRLRAELAAAGRARARAFRWDDCAAQHAALYRELAG